MEVDDGDKNHGHVMNASSTTLQALAGHAPYSKKKVHGYEKCRCIHDPNMLDCPPLTHSDQFIEILAKHSQSRFFAPRPAQPHGRALGGALHSQS
jgi:hypothetical protein